MRQHPIGTGPFKLIDFKPKEYVKVGAQPRLLEAGPALSRRHRTYDYHRPGYRGFGLYCRKVRHDAPGQLTVPLMNEIEARVPQAICEWTPGNVNRHLLVNRDKPPFDNPDLRRAMALSIDRQAFVDIMAKDKARSAVSCSRRPRAYGGCRRRC